MKKINSLLTIIDIYGTKFHLLMNKQLKFKTWIGGIITIILSLIGITFIYFFGEDFFFRKNPSYTESKIGEGYKTINLAKEKIIVAFRTEDINGNFLDSSKYIFPKVIYYSAVPGEDGKSRSNYKQEYISYRVCEESDFEGNENFISLYGTLYCIEWKNLTFGGYWDNEYLYYFSLRLFLCDNNTIYSSNNISKCTSIEDLNNFFSQDVYFSIYYTTTEFRVDSLKNPLSRKHTTYYVTLSHNLRKNERLYLNEQILNDDQGWLISNYKNISVWGADNIKSDFNYFDNEKTITEGYSAMFYSLNIYMASTKYYYTRKYMKIPDVLSMIGGLITLINLIGKFLNISINLSLRKLEIIEKLFDFSDKKLTKSFSFDNINFLNSTILANLNKSNSFDQLDEQNYKNHNEKTLIMDYNKKRFSFNNKNNIGNQKSQDTKFNVKIKKSKFSTEIPKKIKENKSKPKKKEKIVKIEIPKNADNLLIRKDLKRILICCYSRKGEKDIYDLMNEIFNEKCDIIYYFKFCKEMGFIKEILFNPNQILALDFTKKINININNNFDSINDNNQMKKIKIINYFSKRFKSKTNNDIDNFIFDKLELNIKQKINNLNNL